MEELDTDATRAALTRELMSLRIGREPFTAGDIANCPQLVALAGQGSSLLAFDFLMALHGQYRSLPLHAVTAYFQLAGFGLFGTSLEERKREYAAHYFVASRTALRYADKGIEQIAAAILNEEPAPGSQLSGFVDVFQHGESVEGILQFWIEPEQAYAPPRLWINGTELPDVDVPLNDALISEGILFGDRVLPMTPIIPTRVSDDHEWAPLYDLRVRWDVPTLPQWSLSATIADSRVRSTVTGNLSAQATITLDWVTPEWPDPDEPLARLPYWFSSGIHTEDGFGPSIWMTRGSEE